MSCCSANRTFRIDAHHPTGADVLFARNPVPFLLGEDSGPLFRPCDATASYTGPMISRRELLGGMASLTRSTVVNPVSGGIRAIGKRGSDGVMVKYRQYLNQRG
jgi:hypothetical protein